jgi:hypothetical protein
MSMEITKALCLSTVHIRPATSTMLENDDLPLTVWRAGPGFFIPVYAANDVELSEQLPADLVRVMRYAILHECEFVRLDSDGPHVAGIDDYESEWV